ncbi:hypothetical protein Taro_020376 [Colocasia esculenta]|uniref:Uncharacterized protein n=1 Tax=Colocasia esculenta TaxID=4460 RepID=A0A843V508_COLES|nr:hypothetical protein [Colocasia esculenta]
MYAFNGVLYLHWAYIQQVMHMGTDDWVFVPPSGVYKRVGSLMPAAGWCLCHRRTALPLRTSFGDDGGLKRKCQESYDNLWCLLTDEA